MVLLFEGANALAQLVERADGTDMTILSEIALPAGVIGAIAALALAAGLGSLSATMPVAGLGPPNPALSRWAAPLAGFAVYPLVGLVWVAGEHRRGRPNLGLTVFGVITGLVVAAIHPGIVRRAALEPLLVRPETAWRVSAGAVTLVAIMLIVG